MSIKASRKVLMKSTPGRPRYTDSIGRDRCVVSKLWLLLLLISFHLTNRRWQEFVLPTARGCLRRHRHGRHLATHLSDLRPSHKTQWPRNPCRAHVRRQFFKVHFKYAFSLTM